MATKTEADTQHFIREASTWPTIRETAEAWNVPERYVRSMVERRRVAAVRLDFIRINPESWAEYMRAVYRPGDF